MSDTVLKSTATDGHANGAAHRGEWHRGADLFFGIDAQKIDVHHIASDFVILHVAHDSSFALARTAEDKNRILSSAGQSPLETASLHLENRRILLVPIQNTGKHFLLSTQTTHGAFASLVALFDV